MPKRKQRLSLIRVTYRTVSSLKCIRHTRTTVRVLRGATFYTLHIYTAIDISKRARRDIDTPCGIFEQSQSRLLSVKRSATRDVQSKKQPWLIGSVEQRKGCHASDSSH